MAAAGEGGAISAHFNCRFGPHSRVHCARSNRIICVVYQTIYTIHICTAHNTNNNGKYAHIYTIYSIHTIYTIHKFVCSSDSHRGFHCAPARALCVLLKHSRSRCRCHSRRLCRCRRRCHNGVDTLHCVQKLFACA